MLKRGAATDDAMYSSIVLTLKTGNSGSIALTSRVTPPVNSARGSFVVLTTDYQLSKRHLRLRHVISGFWFCVEAPGCEYQRRRR